MRFLSLFTSSVVWLFGFGFSAFAGNTTDITKSDFVIDLTSIDPVGTGNPIIGWSEAAFSLLDTIANLLLFSIPLIAAVSLIIAGYYYILSGGDSEKASQAKTIIKWNLIAIAVALFSYTAITLIARLLDGSLV